MDWIKRLNQAIDFIEKNLDGELDYEDVAGVAGCPSYYFQQMFLYMTDMTLREYIRRRRLSLSAVELQKVWEIVTSLEDTAWRSDLSRVEIIDDKQFVEYTTSGCRTTFTVTVREECRRWEFDMENDNMYGHWTEIFSSKGSVTTIDFTEDVTAEKWFMKPFIGAYLKKQQALYITDLRKALEHTSLLFT